MSKILCGDYMFKNKTPDGKLNICGDTIANLRTRMKLSQRELAEQLQLIGIDVNKNAIQKMECGKRFIIDMEIKRIASFFGITVDELLKERPPADG